MMFNLEEQLIFYGQYHHNRVNKAIHCICVPGILFCCILWGSNYALRIPAGRDGQVSQLSLTFGSLICFSYIALYLLLEPIAGIMLSPFMLGGTKYAHYLVNSYHESANWITGFCFVAAWVAQFVGHGFCERRAPALVDNMIQAVLLAPIFVWMELLFALGYQPKLRQRIDIAVDRAIQDFRKPQG